MPSLARIQAVTTKEFRQLYRDRLSFGMIVGVPLLLILLFGYAINLDVRHLDAAVADLNQTSLSRRIVQDLEATQVLTVRYQAQDDTRLKQMLDAGLIKVGIYIPVDAEDRINRGEKAVQLLIDGSDPTIAGVARAVTDMPIRTAIRGNEGSGYISPRTYYNPENRSSVFIVPAISGVILQLTMVLFTAIAIVRERERGNLELLISTPITRTELMAGKLLPYILIGLLQATIIFVTGFLLFDVDINGSLAELYLAALLFVCAVLALGLVVSTLARSQFQAMQMTLLTLLPSIFLSGYMFPFDGMPEQAQWIGKLLPLTHYIDLVRGIVLRGAPISALSGSVYALIGLFLGLLIVAVGRFRKTID